MRQQLLARGFTLIELLVVTGILSIVAALSLPAVQSAREAARRSKCLSNLHQIGLALQGYESDHGCYPICSTTRVIPSKNDPRAAEVLYQGLFSIHVRLLPYLEHRGIYNAINFAAGAEPLENFGVPPHPTIPALFAINQTSINSHVDTFLCPSDGGPFVGAGNNYRGNVGLGPYVSQWAEYRDSGNGLFRGLGVSRPSYVTDGLSHTASFSERLRGSGRPSHPVPERDFWAWPPPDAASADELLQACRIAARPGASPTFTVGGRWWFWLGRERTLYTHTQQPNGRVPDCLHTNAINAPGMATARSWHLGGVNVLMGDGSARFAQETIDRSVWRGLGTRSGGELVD